MIGKMLLLFVSGFGTAAMAQEAPRAAKDLSVTIAGKTHFKGFIPRHQLHANYIHPMVLDMPTTYDATTAGKATPVKSPGQGSCGDCWAWARTSSVESASMAAGVPSQFAALSEEDTTNNASDEYGCGGGSMDFNYEMSHGITTLALCPWQGGDGGCDSNPTVQGATTAFIGDSNGPTDQEMMAAIYTYGSVAVTVAASEGFDVDSNSDRMSSCDGYDVDHMVSLVGYRPGLNGKVEFKMKNSWDTSWGANGYAYMTLGCNQLATGDQSAMVITAKAPKAPLAGAF